jgi:Stress up-regulated Nod 19
MDMPPLRRTLPLLALLVSLGAMSLAPPRSSAEPAADPGPATQTADVHYGPIVLPAAMGGHAGEFVAVVPALPMPCTNCFLTGTHVDLVFEDGRSANLDNGVMLHHLVVFNTGRPDATCAPETPIGSLGERFYAAGNERTGGTFPSGFGYHYGADRVAAAIDIMNHADHPQVVYVATKVSYVPDSTPGMKPVRPVWLDENDCGDSAYAVPAGPSHKVWRWTSTLTGRVILAGGHVHDGGIKIDLANETTGQPICTSYAGYGTNPAYQGSVESMSTCVWDRLGTVRAGEVLSIDAFYDPPEAQSDVMGIVLAYVYETDDLAGGTPPPPGVQAPAPAWPPPGGRPPVHGHGDAHGHHH